MPVVINELEIVVAEEPVAAPPEGREGRAAPAPAAPPLGPLEVSLILERRIERELRVLAY